MLPLNEVAAQLMEHLVTHEWHGYSQGARWGDGEGFCVVNIDGRDYYLEQGDRDCSSAIISAYKAAGLYVDATYTGNMRQAFLATGLFEWHDMSFTAQRGDIYLNEVYHTAMCLSSEPDLLAEFRIAETGGIYGQVGDQTGSESWITNYYNYPWNGILHYIGPSNPEPSDEEEIVKQEDIDAIAAATWNYPIGTNAVPGYENRPAWTVLSWTNYDTWTRQMNNFNESMSKLQGIENTMVGLNQRIDILNDKLNRLTGGFEEV